MNCLGSEELAAYLRGRGDSRIVEEHVRDCPACAMEILLARETFHEMRARGTRPATDRFRATRRRPASWLPWAAAAAVVLVAILAFALRPSPPPVEKKEIAVTPGAAPVPRPPAKERSTPAPAVEAPRVPLPPPEPNHPPATERPSGKEPEPRPAPAPPKPEPKPKPTEGPPEPPTPQPPPPAPEPRKAAPTLVERMAVAKVTRSVGGGTPGKMLFAGDVLQTARQEFTEVALEGYGSLYVRENSRVEMGVSGEIHLHDGEMFARLDAGRMLGGLKTPAGEIDIQSSLFGVQASKLLTEITLVDGRASIGAVGAKGPAALVSKSGKAAEVRGIDPGFLSWLPEKLATRRFSGWTEAETFPSLQGFKVADLDGASGRKALVQVAEQGSAGTRLPLPWKGKYALFLRVREYEAKPVLLGLQVNGQSLGELKVEYTEAKPWRWVGPWVVTGDRLDLAVTALSRFPQGGSERNSFPVVLDAVYVTTDPKPLLPERLTEERRAFDLVLDEPGK